MLMEAMHLFIAIMEQECDFYSLTSGGRTYFSRYRHDSCAHSDSPKARHPARLPFQQRHFQVASGAPTRSPRRSSPSQSLT